MSDTLVLVVIFLMLLVGALEKLFPQKLNMCKILLCIISLRNQAGILGYL